MENISREGRERWCIIRDLTADLSMNDTIYFSRPMKFTASIFRHRTRPINILPPSIDRSIDFYPPGKRYQLTLSLHVCIRTYMNFVVMIHFPIFFFFFGNVDPFLGSRDHQTFDRFWFAVQRDPLNGEFSITSIEFLTIFEKIYTKSLYLR